MSRFVTAAITLAAATTVAAQNNPWTGPLNQTALLDSLSILEEGLEQSLPETNYNYTQWSAGWIPQEVSDIVTNNKPSCPYNIGLNAADMTTWNVQYDDCGDPWTFSLHSEVNVTIDSMATQFGRLPVQMRQYVRHIIGVPGNPYAFNCDGSITFVRPVDNMQNVFVHETGHSLDLQGAYSNYPVGTPLSGSNEWWGNVSADSYAPDNYARTNYLEDVAQNTVVAVFNENYPGGFGAVAGNYSLIGDQYYTIITQAALSGDGNSLLVPGESDACTHRLANSPAISVNPSSRVRRYMGDMPDTEIKTVPSREPHSHDGLACDIMH